MLRTTIGSAPPRRWIRAASALALVWLLVPGAREASGEGNPPGCSDPTVNIDIQEWLDIDGDGMITDGVDLQLLPFETKIPGQVILYRAVLSHGGAQRCGFERGRVCIDLPQLGCGAQPFFNPPSFTTVGPGECCAADLVTPVPLVCDPATCVPPGVARYESDPVRYVVNPADIENQTLCPPGHLRATAYYDVGFSKQGEPTDPDVFPANASIPICNPLQIEVRDFMCYEPVKISAARTVTLADRFRTVQATLGDLKRICNPADKNFENPEALLFPDHLASYEVDAPAFTNRKVLATNQFGTSTLELLRTTRLLVPTAKGPLGPPPQPPAGPPNPPMIDHFLCYAVRGPAVRQVVTVDDQFGRLLVDVRQPALACFPVDKNGEGFVNPNGEFGLGLTCYDNNTSPSRQTFTGDFIMNNQLTGGNQRRGLHGPREFCVQSSFVPAP
jgi:hypothetical protein